MTLDAMGIEIDRMSGDEAWALCPSPKHDDRSASWSINLNTGSHHCFSCGWGGNFLWLVRTAKGWDKKPEDGEKAEEWIRKHGGIEVARKKLRGETAYTRKQAEPVTEADLALFTDPPAGPLRDRDLELDSALAYGIRWDPKRRLWILPIRDPFTNALMGWQEKGKDVFNNWPMHVEKARTVFGYHLLGEVGYLEESPLDCVRLHTYSLDGAVSGYGVHVTDWQLDLIFDKVETLYVCLDNDEAGRKREAEIWRDWRHRGKMLFANYDHVQGKNFKKDHGDMTPDEIEYSLTEAVSSLRYRPDEKYLA